MTTFFQIVVLFMLGFGTGFLATICGGGGLISIPGLMLFGLPAPIAVATNRFAAVGLWLTGVWKFWREGKIVEEFVLKLSLVALAGGFTGSQLLAATRSALLDSVIAWVILLMLPIVYFSDKLGQIRVETSPRRKALGYLLFFVVTAFGGFFSAGDGTLGLYVMISCFGLTMTEGSATRGIPWLFLGIGSVSTFISQGMVDYFYGCCLLPGMMSGAYVGAHTAIKRGDRWVKGVFALMVFAMSLKLLWPTS